MISEEHKGAILMRSSAPDLASVSLARLHTLQLLNSEPKSELLANIQDNRRNCRLILWLGG
jgi:hypothetical protein